MPMRKVFHIKEVMKKTFTKKQKNKETKKQKVFVLGRFTYGLMIE